MTIDCLGLGGKEIRFTSASNPPATARHERAGAFSSLAYAIAGNGCRPTFSEIPCLPMIPRTIQYCIESQFAKSSCSFQSPIDTIVKKHEWPALYAADQ